MKRIFFLIAIAAFFIGLILPFFVLAADPVKFCGQVDIPLLNTIFKKSIDPEKKDCTVIDSNSIGKMVGDIYKFVVGLAAIAAVIVMMAGGYTWLFAGGNASKVGEAKSLIGSAVLGLFLALGSYMILNLINPELTKLKSLDQMNSKITPISATLMTADAICTIGEEEEAQVKEKTTSGGGINRETCGKVYENRHCIRVLCPKTSMLNSTDYICLLNADEEGKFTGGGCASSVKASYINPLTNYAASFTYIVDEKNGMACGQVTKPYQCGISGESCVYKDYSACQATINGIVEITTCTLIAQKGQKSDPFVDNSKDWIAYYYKGNQKWMDCAPGYK